MRKRVLSLILAFVLIIGVTTSLSSCLYLTCYFPFDKYFPSLGIGCPGGGTDDDGSAGIGTQDGGNSDGGNEGEGSQNQDGGSDSTASPDFYPGVGDIETEDLSPSAKALLCCVSITSTFTKAAYDGSTLDYSYVGSGVIYNLNKSEGDAYIITNYHVIYSSSALSSKISNSISVYLYGQESQSYAINATFVGGSMTQDIAVLRVENSEIIKNSCVTEATFNTSDVSVLDTVVAIGNPEGNGISATSGIVSQDSETLSITGPDGVSKLGLRVIRVSAGINEGNSGGGLFNTNGEVVGIVCAKKTGSDVDNIAYAIPSSLAKNYADSIIRYCNGNTVINPYKCVIGVLCTAKTKGVAVDENTGRVSKVELVEVSGLQGDCLLKGKLAVGDIMNSITVDGVTKEITRIHHLIDHVLTAKAGSTIVLNVTRGTQSLNLSVVVPEAALTQVY